MANIDIDSNPPETDINNEDKTNSNKTKSVNNVNKLGLSHSEMFTQILLMTLQCKSDSLDTSGLSELINKKNANPFIFDLDGNSLLHWSSWRQLSNLNEWFLTKYNTSSKISQFNIHNNLNQTPIHWACMSGDVLSTKYFIEFQEEKKKNDKIFDIYAKDVDGFNGIHCAAQFNHAAILEYLLFKFRDKLRLNEIDNKGRTALHWAVYKENTIIVDWLLQNNINSTIIDENGETALHIASKKGLIKSVETMLRNIKNDDILYKLLEMKNNENLTCFELAKKSNSKGISKLLSKIESRRHNLICSLLTDLGGDFAFFNNAIMPKSTMKKVGFFLNIFFIILQSSGILMDIFIFWEIGNVWIHYILLFIAFLAVIFKYLTTIIDAGVIQKPSKQEEIEMFNNNNNNSYITHLLSGQTSKICITCHVVKEFRSKHCSYCNQCVRVFDHHCPWVNNCIGENNYKIFIIFMFLELCAMIYLLTLSFIYYLTSNNIQYSAMFITVPILFIIFCVTIFVIFQIITHSQFITKGLTTNEHVNMYRYNYFRDSNGNVRNPFYKGWRKNWMIFLFECCNEKLKKDKMVDIENAVMIARAHKYQPEHVHNEDCKHNHKNNDNNDKVQVEN